MRIAFLNRGRDAHPGGDVIALDATMAALRRKGVECEETGWDATRIRQGGFNLCHIFHCNFSWSWGNYCAIQSSRAMPVDIMPYVLTPVYYPGLLSGITQAQLSEMVLSACLVLPFSNREASELRDAVGFFPYQAIPNGTDPAFHCTIPASEREGVLCVSARGVEDKGIPMVRAACERLGLPFTAVSGVAHADLPAIYARHRVFVNASDSERMSLTVGEALCAGCKVLAHPGNRGNEWYGVKFTEELVTPQIDKALLDTYQMLDGFWWEAQEAARRLTWDLVADRLIEVYKWVLR